MSQQARLTPTSPTTGGRRRPSTSRSTGPSPTTSASSPARRPPAPHSFVHLAAQGRRAHRAGSSRARTTPAVPAHRLTSRPGLDADRVRLGGRGPAQHCPGRGPARQVGLVRPLARLPTTRCLPLRVRRPPASRTTPRSRSSGDRLRRPVQQLLLGQRVEQFGRQRVERRSESSGAGARSPAAAGRTRPPAGRPARRRPRALEQHGLVERVGSGSSSGSAAQRVVLGRLAELFPVELVERVGECVVERDASSRVVPARRRAFPGSSSSSRASQSSSGSRTGVRVGTAARRPGRSSTSPTTPSATLINAAFSSSSAVFPTVVSSQRVVV